MLITDAGKLKVDYPFVKSCEEIFSNWLLRIIISIKEVSSFDCPQPFRENFSLPKSSYNCFSFSNDNLL